jgi:hypothetical protein
MFCFTTIGEMRAAGNKSAPGSAVYVCRCQEKDDITSNTTENSALVSSMLPPQCNFQVRYIYETAELYHHGTCALRTGIGKFMIIIPTTP